MTVEQCHLPPGMLDDWNLRLPSALAHIRAETAAAGFHMASEDLTGALLRTLAASKPEGEFLELGTGTGVGTAWLLAGMSGEARLDTVDNDSRLVAIAQQALSADPRVTFHVADGATFLRSLRNRRFDLIFADTWPGKFDHLDDALDLLRPGGFYLIDDLLPQPNWAEGHAEKIGPLMRALAARTDLHVTRLAWSTGLLLATKSADAGDG